MFNFSSLKIFVIHDLIEYTAYLINDVIYLIQKKSLKKELNTYSMPFQTVSIIFPYQILQFNLLNKMIDTHMLEQGVHMRSKRGKCFMF